MATPTTTQPSTECRPPIPQEPTAAAVERASAVKRVRGWLGSINTAALPPFCIRLGGGAVVKSRPAGDPQFEISVRDQRGLKALTSGRESAIVEAYLRGRLDVHGDFLAALSLRPRLRRPSALLGLLFRLPAVWLGKIEANRRAIRFHYDHDEDFYLQFLDETRTYSHGVFEDDDEPLATAMSRKLDFAMDACRLAAGDRVLDVGGGWGAFTEHAGARGVEVTSLTISSRSKQFIERLIARKGLPCRVVERDFLDYSEKRKFDAIVVLGVLEHMPDYKRVIRRFEQLLKPGGRIYIDGSATRGKYAFNSFLKRHIYPGNHCAISLDNFLSHLKSSSLELLQVINDRRNYYLTAKAWAERLESKREAVVRRFGEGLYRRFRMYFWGVCHGFATDRLQAYRIVMQTARPYATLPPGAEV